MKKYGDVPIGEVFEYDGHTYKVIEDSWDKEDGICNICAFLNDLCHQLACINHQRHDNTHVYFKNIEDEED